MFKKANKSMEKLAQAMTKLADNLEKFQDPVLWQKMLSDAIGMGVLPQSTVDQLQPPLVPRATGVVGLPIARVESVQISLSDEERERLATKVYEAVQPELAQFTEFVKESLNDMPPYRLKELATKVEEGIKPSLGRRKGCVFIEAGDNDYYLGL